MITSDTERGYGSQSFCWTFRAVANRSILEQTLLKVLESVVLPA